MVSRTASPPLAITHQQPCAHLQAEGQAWASTYTSSKWLSSFLLLRLQRPLPRGAGRDSALQALPAALRARRSALQNLEIVWGDALAGRLSLGQLLASLQPLTALTSLSLWLPDGGSWAGAVAAQHLGALSSLTGLEQLDIKTATMQADLSGVLLPGVDHLSRLQRLQLPHHAPTSSGMARIGRLSGLTALTIVVGAPAAPGSGRPGPADRAAWPRA